MQALSHIASVVLLLVAAVGRRPHTAVMSLVLSLFFAVPVVVFSKGANSAVFVTDVVLFGVLLRWGPTAIRNIFRDGAPTGSGSLCVLLGLVVLSRVLVVARTGTMMSVYHLGFYSLRFLAFGLTFVVIASLRLELGAYRKLLTWISLLTVAFAAANVVSQRGIVNLHFYVGDLLASGGRGVNIGDTQYAHTALLGFNRATVGLFAYVGIVLLLLRSWLGGTTNKFMLFVCLPLLGFLLLDSFSRAAVAAVVVAFVLMSVRLRVGQLLGLAFVLAFGGSIVLLVASDPGAWADRFAALFSRDAFEGSTGRSRMEDWLSVLRYLGGHPQHTVLGVGFLGYASHYHVATFVSFHSAAHNMYLQALTELGIFGLAFFVALWGRLLLYFRRAGKRGGGDRSRELIGRVMFVFLAGLLVSGISQETLYPVPAMYSISTLAMLIMASTVSTLRQLPAPVGAVGWQGQGQLM